MTPGCDSLYAATCLSIGVHLPYLLSKGAPLFDPQLVGVDGKPLSGALSPGHMQRARRFGVEHARHLVFAPSAALASYDTVYLFFLLREPTSLLERERMLVEQVQRQLAAVVHAGYAPKIGGWIPLPLEWSKDGGPRVPARLLWARRTIHDIDKLDRWTRSALECASVARTPQSRSKRAPPEMRLRTLLDDYELADLELPPAIRQLIAAGSSSNEIIVLDELPRLVDAMTSAGYGFEDVRLVVSDSRFPLSLSTRIDTSHCRGLALRFRNALRSVNHAYPVRLPYGISSILLLSGGDQETDRYVVRGGTRKTAFKIEVSHDTLISARRFHRALASHIRGFPYRVPQEVWEEVVLRRGLQDPRIRLRHRADARRKDVSLVERIEAFAARAKPLAPWHAESGDSIPWPILRDGQVVFRLAILQERLTLDLEGPAPRRGQVTAAVRAAGGAPHGAMRFGSRVIRVWTLPAAGRSDRSTPRHGQPPA